ncbi:MAG TPA: type VI secretion system tip protein VgrG [Sunxiuqinia sp.]|nr:type VI secretion system tip protein VgrG [Sunxiuqinia sp.]
MATVLQQTDGILNIEISIDGSRIKDTIEVLEISIEAEVNRIPTATIVVDDGGPIGLVNDPFSNSQGSDFIPGKEVEISLGYDSVKKTAFKGIIVSQSLSVKNSQSRLSVVCKDKAVKMTKGRLNSMYSDGKDSDALSSIVGNYGLTLTNDSTTPELPALMQYNCSDWDFVVIRAEMNNMVVVANQNELTIKEYDFSSRPDYEINCSQIVIDMDLNLDSENIAGEYEMNAWDDDQQQSTQVTSALDDGLKQGNLTSKSLSDAVGYSKSSQFSSTSMESAELTAWGKSLSSKAVLSKIQGKITIPGTTSLKAGDLVAISGFSTRFNGNAFISKVSHELREGTWLTIVQVGKSPQWHSALPDITDIAASGLIPAANGSQIATVKKIDSDPKNKYRVQVTLPVLSAGGSEIDIWARLAFPYASNQAGFFFYPEIGDEVLLSFINNDPRYPVITGALYSAKNKPNEDPVEDNQYKAVYSKSGIKIRFDDTDKILVIDTPGGNSFTLDDKNKNAILKDMNGNSVTLDDSGIALDSATDIKLTAQNNVDINATGGITMKANSDVKVDGLNVEMNAQVGFTAKGNATAEVSASGQTTVKGAMVMIN